MKKYYSKNFASLYLPPFFSLQKYLYYSLFFIFLSPGASVQFVQLGNDLDGESDEGSMGWSVSLSENGLRMAVGEPGDDTNGSNAGQVRVFDWNGTAWTQVGNDILGEDEFNFFGSSVSLSDDGNRLAIGACGNNDAGEGAGHVRVYDWNGSAWIQVGNDMRGVASQDQFGFSVAMASTGQAIVVGAPAGPGGGYVEVYDRRVGQQWTLRGVRRFGEASGDEYGWSVSMSHDGNTIAVGGPKHVGTNGSNSGHVQVLDWDDGDKMWKKRGDDLE